MSGQLTRRTMLGAAACAVLPPLTVHAAPARQPVEVAPGVYVFVGVNQLMTAENAGHICNVGLVVGSSSAAFIDSGGSIIDAESMIAAARNITKLPISHVINTHMHPDHVFGNAAFTKIGATIVGHHNLPEALASRRDDYLQNFTRDMGAEAMKGVQIVPPTVLVDKDMDLDLGGRILHLKAWAPAHTDNDLTILDSTTSTLFAGDLLFLEHVPTLDGSLLGWLKQMDELAAIKAARAVPGHGPASVAWPAALADERRYFEALARDLRQSIKAGERMSQAVTKAAQSEAKRWELFDEYNERNAATAFAELEWEQ